jgi:hypothetical protein
LLKNNNYKGLQITIYKLKMIEDGHFSFSRMPEVIDAILNYDRMQIIN